MKINNRYSALLLAISSVLAASSATAANSFYAPGDLVLYFQKEGGTNTVYANLGAATGYRGSAAGAADGTNSYNILDLNTTLTSAFGAGWASDSTVYAGLAGVLSNSNTSSTVTSGDPTRTLYVSASRSSVGTVGQASSSGYTVNTNNGMTTAAGGIQNQNSAFENNYDSLITVSPTATSLIDEQNLFVGPGVLGAAFSTFGSGVQQQGAAGSFGSFGEVGNVEFALDLYRILARGTGGTGNTGTGTAPLAGQVAGDLRVGSYEGTVTVNSSGLVSFVAIPEPSSTALLGLAAGALILRRRRLA